MAFKLENYPSIRSEIVNTISDLSSLLSEADDVIASDIPDVGKVASIEFLTDKYLPQ